MNKNLKVAVIYGGKSSEREVSLQSGDNVAKALQSKGYETTLIDYKSKEDLIVFIKDKFDVVYNALHGKGGEDGTMQGFLETIGIPYTGSKILSSALGINKAYTKHVYNSANIPTSPFVTVSNNVNYSVDEIISKLGGHLVIKVASEGSSIGLFIAESKEQIEESIQKALNIGDLAVVEKFIEGDEFTCAAIKISQENINKYNLVANSNGIVAFPVIQIIPKNEFYDFESKYAKGGSNHICPAPISDELTESIQKFAIKAYENLKCSGVARTDFIVDKNGNPWALETNTLPGMTSTSLVPDSAKQLNISFEDLCELIIQEALKSN